MKTVMAKMQQSEYGFGYKDEGGINKFLAMVCRKDAPEKARVRFKQTSTDHPCIGGMSVSLN